MNKSDVLRKNKEEEGVTKTYLDLPREYSRRGNGSGEFNLTLRTGSARLMYVIRTGKLIRQIEGMTNKQKVKFAAFANDILVDSKFKGVYDGAVKSVGEYARLYGDADWDTADYLELNKRFRNRIDPYVWLYNLYSSSVIDDKDLIIALLGFCAPVESDGSVVIKGYSRPVNTKYIQRLLDGGTIIRVDIEGESDSRFLGTTAEWQWLLDSGKKFKAYSK